MSHSPSHDPDRSCPECGASIPAQANVCWLCRSRVTERGSGTAAPDRPGTEQAVGGTPFGAPSQPAPSAAHHAHLQFSLASLMLAITLCAVALGAATIHPGLGIGVAVLATPAFIHTAVTAVRRRERGRRMTPAEKLAFFCGSLGAFVVTLVAAGIAFYATCWVGFFGGMAVGEGVGVKGYGSIGWGLVTGTILGGIAGLVVLVLLIRLFVRRYRRRSV
jgi:hypothetical protein